MQWLKTQRFNGATRRKTRRWVARVVNCGTSSDRSVMRGYSIAALVACRVATRRALKKSRCFRSHAAGLASVGSDREEAFYETVAQRHAAVDLRFRYERCDFRRSRIPVLGGRDHPERGQRSRTTSSLALADETSATDGRISEWLSCDWPPNLWVATSITTQKSISRVKHLLRVGDDTTTRFLSVEPQWEAIDLERWLPEIDWVLQGGESGPKAHEFPILGSLVKENQTTSGMNQRFITWRCPTALRAGLTTEMGQSL